MRYLIIDGMISGTGIRGSYEGGYVDPSSLNISEDIQNRISIWLSNYKDAHFNNYSDQELNDELDAEGIQICKLLQREIPDSKIDYYSEATCKRIYLSDLK